jgi:RHS repeat-associated protein
LQADSPDDLAYGFEGKHGIGTDTDAGGIVLMGARLYNPATGRFLQVEPRFSGSANAYDYVDQDPDNASDLAGTDLGDAGGGDDGVDAAPDGEVLYDELCDELDAQGEELDDENFRLATKIANGHAYDDHVVEKGEYPEITSRAQFRDLIYSILEGDVDTVDKPLDDGRYAYYAPDGTVVIVDPGHPDWGTAFRPKNPLAYFLGLDS